MPNYDLGTAHGRIVVDYDDKGSSRAEKAFLNLSKHAGVLRKNFGKLGDSFRSLSSDIDTTSLRLGRALGTLAGSSQLLLAASDNVGLFRGSLLRLKGTTGIIRSLRTSIHGVPEAMRNYPSAIQRIVRLSAGIALLKSSSGALMKVAGRLGLLQKAAPAVAALGIRIGVLNERFASMGKASRGISRAFSALRGADASIKMIASLAFAAVSATKAIRGFAKMINLAARASIALGAAAAVLVKSLKVVGHVALGAWDALKQLSGIVLLLPGMLASAAAALGTLILGFKGFGGALKKLGGTQEEFNEAIKDLAPSAQEAAKALRSLKPAFDDMQLEVQQTLFQGLGDKIRQIGEKAMPALHKGTVNVAGGFNNMANELLNFVGSSKFLDNIPTLFQTTREVVDNLSGALRPVLEALTDIGTVGMQAMSDLTDGAAGAAEKFRAFIDEARKTGQLRRWIDDAIQGFRDLWAILKNTGDAIGNVFRAFTGSGGGQNALATLRDMTESFKNMTDPASQTGQQIKEFVGALKEISGVYLGALGEFFRQLTPIIKDLAPTMKDLSITIGQQLATAFQVIGPILRVFVNLLKALLEIPGMKQFVASLVAMAVAVKGLAIARAVLAPFTAGVSALISTASALRSAPAAFRNLRNAAMGLGGATGPLSRFSNKLSAVVTSVGAFGGKIRGAFSRAAGGVRAGAMRMASAASRAGSGIANGLRGAATAAATAGSAIASGMGRAAKAMGRWAAATATAAARGVAKMAMIAATAVATAAATVASWIAQAAAAVANAAVIAASWLIAYWPIALIIAAVIAVAAAIIMYWDQIKAFLVATWNFIKNVAITVWNAIKAFFIAFWNGIKAVTMAVWNAIKTFLITTWNLIKTIALAVWNGLKAFFIAFWTGIKIVFMTIWNAIKAFLLMVWNGIKVAAMAIWNGLKAFFTGLWNGIKAVTMAVWNGIKAFLSGAWNAIKAVATAVWNALKAVVMAVWNGIKSFITGAVNSIKSFISSGFNAAKNLAVNAFNALKSGVMNVTSALMSFISGIPGKIMGFLGDLGSLLISSGKALIQGFIDGIKAMIGAVGDAVSSVVSKVTDFMPWSPAKEGPLSGKGWVYYSGLTIGPAFADGILKNKKSVTDAMQNFMYGMNESVQQNMPGFADMRDHGQKMVDGLVQGLRDRYGYMEESFNRMAGKVSNAANVGQAVNIARNSTFADQLSSEINKAFAGIEGSGVLRYSGGRFTAQGQATVPGTGSLIGSLTVEAPQGADAQEVIDEAMFAVRRAGKGVYN